MQTEFPTRKRRFQFSLRTLLIVATVAAIVSALVAAIASRLPNENHLTQKELQSVKPGMTEVQVQDLLGKPDGITPNGIGAVYWEYGGLWPDLVEFKDGRVVTAFRF